MLCLQLIPTRASLRCLGVEKELQETTFFDLVTSCHKFIKKMNLFLPCLQWIVKKKLGKKFKVRYTGLIAQE